jgi:DNA-binding XRE family transcriptional regulator
MQVVAKTPRIDLRISGDIPEKVLKVLREEYGDLQIVIDHDEDLLEMVNTEWYKGVKATLTPGAALRTYRENAGLTQEALGKLIGQVPRQHISGMEKGRRPIGKEMAKRLAAALRTSPMKFFEAWD